MIVIDVTFHVPGVWAALLAIRQLNPDRVHRSREPVHPWDPRPYRHDDREIIHYLPDATATARLFSGGNNYYLVVYLVDRFGGTSVDGESSFLNSLNTVSIPIGLRKSMHVRFVTIGDHFCFTE